MKKVILAITLAFGFAGFVTVPASAAVTPANPAVSCTPAIAISPYNDSSAGSWNDPHSPYTLYFYSASSGKDITGYCPESVGSLEKLFQSGTHRCLYLDTSSHTIIERSSCTSSYAKWHEIVQTMGQYATYFEIQNWGDKACMVYEGTSKEASYSPCKVQSDQMFSGP
jgi:hypothetical protein